MTEPRRPVADLEPGQPIDQVFLVRDKDLRRTASGGLYVACTLADKTGSVQGRMWQASEARFASIPVETFARVTGRAESYRGQLQVIVDGVACEDLDGVDLADFLPTTPHDIEAMWDELGTHLRAIESPHVLRLVLAFLEDRELVERFKRAPAASQVHHAYVGGLLEHTLGVVRLARAVAPLYPEALNADLLVAGAFLHDIGKVDEIRADATLSYTDRGNLVGHIVAAAVWIEQRAREVTERTGQPFPQRVLDLLVHLVVAHHGTMEFGSPKVPATPEAAVLHFIDNLDARVQMFARAVGDDRNPGASFTAYSRPLGSKVFKRTGDLDE